MHGIACLACTQDTQLLQLSMPKCLICLQAANRMYTWPRAGTYPLFTHAIALTACQPVENQVQHQFVEHSFYVSFAATSKVTLMQTHKGTKKHQ